MTPDVNHGPKTPQGCINAWKKSMAEYKLHECVEGWVKNAAKELRSGHWTPEVFTENLNSKCEDLTSKHKKRFGSEIERFKTEGLALAEKLQGFLIAEQKRQQETQELKPSDTKSEADRAEIEAQAKKVEEELRGKEVPLPNPMTLSGEGAEVKPQETPPGGDDAALKEQTTDVADKNGTTDAGAGQAPSAEVSGPEAGRDSVASTAETSEAKPIALDLHTGPKYPLSFDILSRVRDLHQQLDDDFNGRCEVKRPDSALKAVTERLKNQWGLITESTFGALVSQEISFSEFEQRLSAAINESRITFSELKGIKGFGSPAPGEMLSQGYKRVKSLVDSFSFFAQTQSTNPDLIISQNREAILDDGRLSLFIGRRGETEVVFNTQLVPQLPAMLTNLMPANGYFANGDEAITSLRDHLAKKLFEPNQHRAGLCFADICQNFLREERDFEKTCRSRGVDQSKISLLKQEFSATFNQSLVPQLRDVERDMQDLFGRLVAVGPVEEADRVSGPHLSFKSNKRNGSASHVVSMLRSFKAELEKDNPGQLNLSAAETALLPSLLRAGWLRSATANEIAEERLSLVRKSSDLEIRRNAIRKQIDDVELEAEKKSERNKSLLKGVGSLLSGKVTVDENRKIQAAISQQRADLVRQHKEATEFIRQAAQDLKVLKDLDIGGQKFMLTHSGVVALRRLSEFERAPIDFGIEEALGFFDRQHAQVERRTDRLIEMLRRNRGHERLTGSAIQAAVSSVLYPEGIDEKFQSFGRFCPRAVTAANTLRALPGAALANDDALGIAAHVMPIVKDANGNSRWISSPGEFKLDERVRGYISGRVSVEKNNTGERAVQADKSIVLEAVMAAQIPERLTRVSGRRGQIEDGTYSRVNDICDKLKAQMDVNVHQFDRITSAILARHEGTPSEVVKTVSDLQRHLINGGLVLHSKSDGRQVGLAALSLMEITRSADTMAFDAIGVKRTIDLMVELGWRSSPEIYPEAAALYVSAVKRRVPVEILLQDLRSSVVKIEKELAQHGCSYDVTNIAVTMISGEYNPALLMEHAGSLAERRLPRPLGVAGHQYSTPGGSHRSDNFPRYSGYADWIDQGTPGSIGAFTWRGVH